MLWKQDVRSTNMALVNFECSRRSLLLRLQLLVEQFDLGLRLLLRPLSFLNLFLQLGLEFLLFSSQHSEIPTKGLSIPPYASEISLEAGNSLGNTILF